MDELAKTAQRLSREIDPGWSADHVEDCLTRYHGRVARRRELRRVAVGLACVGGAVLLVLGLSRLGGQDERRPELAGGTSQPRMAPLFSETSRVVEAEERGSRSTVLPALVQSGSNRQKNLLQAWS